MRMQIPRSPQFPLSPRFPRGFTLVELIVVIGIIGVLATMIVVRYAGQTDQAKVAAAKAQIAQIEGAVIAFQSHNSRLPYDLSELVQKPSDTPRWQEGGYLKGKTVSKDPWGRDYVYKMSGRKFEIFCLGADGKEGGTGVDSDFSNENMEPQR